MRTGALLLALAVLIAACGAETDQGPVQIYDVRGVVAQLPAGPGKELMIEHEEIPDFVGASGDTVGMEEMTMGFPVAEGVSLEGFAVGDSVRFTFEVRWNGSPPLRLTRMVKR